MPSAPAADGGSASGTLLPLRAIALSMLILGAVIALCWAFFRHPVPVEAVLTGPWSIMGKPIAAPFEVMFLDVIFMDDDAMSFGIRDGQGTVTMVRCPWTRDGADPERLLFYPSLPHGNDPAPDDPPLEITQDRALVRNVLFHAMAHRDFHARAIECTRAYQLYPSRFDRLRFWLQGP